MSLILPVISFAMGAGLADRLPQLKSIFARVLSQVLIPFVIIYNMVFYQTGSIYLIVFSFLSSALLYLIYWQLYQDKIQALCASYPNLAWLGFPVAFAIFGNSVSAAMVALYIGGSLFGNIVAVSALSRETHTFAYFLKNILRSPPIIALLLAAICRLLGLQYLSTHVILDSIYLAVKFAMTFAGMFVLGMWLRHVKLSYQDLWSSFKLSIIRMMIGAAICTLIWFSFLQSYLQHYITLMFMLFFSATCGKYCFIGNLLLRYREISILYCIGNYNQLYLIIDFLFDLSFCFIKYLS